MRPAFCRDKLGLPANAANVNAVRDVLVKHLGHPKRIKRLQNAWNIPMRFTGAAHLAAVPAIRQQKLMVYYNELEPYVAQWLKNLCETGELPVGIVDERDIREVQPHELAQYEQCHLFAGIGGWPLALDWAGWKGPAWTSRVRESVHGGTE